MSWKILAATAIVLFLIVAQRKQWVDFSGKTKPKGTQVFGVFDEIFAPARHEALLVQQERREAPMRFNESDNPFDAAINIHLERKSSQ